VPSYEKVCKGNRTALVRAEWAACIAEALLENKGCTEFGEGGRGTLARFDYEEGHGLIRKYRRGGFIRHFLTDAYILDNRAKRELDLTDDLLEKGLPVPMPLGACWERRGILYRGSLATHLLDATDLRDELDNGPADPEDIMRRAGECIRRMHDLGVYHADLQVHNILVTPQQQIYLIDFDKAQRQPRLSQIQRARNLLRFRRSLEKNDLPLDLFPQLCEGYGVKSLPAWLTRTYQVKGKLSDTASFPRSSVGMHTAQKAHHEIGIPTEDRGNEVRIERRPGMTLYLRPGLNADALLDALKTPGETLKTSQKSNTRRVGEWVVKESQPEAGLGILKRTFYRNRYRQAWQVSIHLEQNGILAPTPIAFIEKGRLGVITGNIFICQYLKGCHNVEQHAAQLANPGNAEHQLGNTDEINAFLTNLAQAVNKLCAANVYHADLSGKNIFTPQTASTENQAFYFIDLDGATIDTPYTQKRRQKNHVQLYDSFCDLFDDPIMTPFIQQMTPPQYNINNWFPTIKKAQKKRRARTQQRQTRQKK